MSSKFTRSVPRSRDLGYSDAKYTSALTSVSVSSRLRTISSYHVSSASFVTVGSASSAISKCTSTVLAFTVLGVHRIRTSSTVSGSIVPALNKAASGSKTCFATLSLTATRARIAATRRAKSRYPSSSSNAGDGSFPTSTLRSRQASQRRSATHSSPSRRNSGPDKGIKSPTRLRRTCPRYDLSNSVAASNTRAAMINGRIAIRRSSCRSQVCEVTIDIGTSARTPPIEASLPSSRVSCVTPWSNRAEKVNNAPRTMSPCRNRLDAAITSAENCSVPLFSIAWR